LVKGSSFAIPTITKTTQKRRNSRGSINLPKTSTDFKISLFLCSPLPDTLVQPFFVVHDLIMYISKLITNSSLFYHTLYLDHIWKFWVEVKSLNCEFLPGHQQNFIAHLSNHIPVSLVALSHPGRI
jgi:hypothetical protein